MWRLIGQSTIEYLVIVAGIVAALMLARGVIKERISNSYEHMAGMVENSVTGVKP